VVHDARLAFHDRARRDRGADDVHRRRNVRMEVVVERIAERSANITAPPGRL
jgi:hypothetical protein